MFGFQDPEFNNIIVTIITFQPRVNVPCCWNNDQLMNFWATQIIV